MLVQVSLNTPQWRKWSLQGWLDRSTSLAPLSTLNETQLASLLTLAPYLQCNVMSAYTDEMPCLY